MELTQLDPVKRGNEALFACKSAGPKGSARWLVALGICLLGPESAGDLSCRAWHT